MRKDADKFLSNQGWIVDGPVDSGLMYCYNENKIKEPLQIKIRNNQIFECEMKSCSLYRMFRVCAHTLAASKKKGVFQTFIYKTNCRGNSGVVSNIVNSGEKMTQERRNQNQHKDVESGKSTNSSNKRCSRTAACCVWSTISQSRSAISLSSTISRQVCSGSERYCHLNVESCSKEIFRSDAINYDDMVTAGNTQRAIFDVQTQKYMVSSNSQNIYLLPPAMHSEQRCFFHTNNGWISTRFKAFLVESKQINVDGIWYSELDLSGNKIRETPRKHETGKQRKTWWYWSQGNMCSFCYLHIA